MDMGLPWCASKSFAAHRALGKHADVREERLLSHRPRHFGPGPIQLAVRAGKVIGPTRKEIGFCCGSGTLCRIAGGEDNGDEPES